MISLTNEELVERIQTGETEYILILWDQIKPYTRSRVYRYFARLSSRCAVAGVQSEDLIQESYLALLDAIETYKTDCGYYFISHLKYRLQNQFNHTARLRLASQRDDILNRDRLDIVSRISEESALMFAEVIPDKTAEEAFGEVELSQLQRVVRNEIDKLPEDLRDITILYMICGHSFAKCSEILGVKEGTLRGRFDNARKHLRRNMILRNLYFDYYSEGLKGTGLTAYRNHAFTSSTESAVLRKLELDFL